MSPCRVLLCYQMICVFNQEHFPTMLAESPVSVCLIRILALLDGIEATRQIKKALPRTSIIGFSVQTDATIHRVMHEAGAVTFLARSGLLNCLRSSKR